MDNYFQQCPPMMSDDRLFRDWQSATRLNEYIKYVNKHRRDDRYRLFLQQNGLQIMENTWEYNKRHNRCWVNEPVHIYPTRTLPQFFSQEMEAHDATYKLTMDSCPSKRNTRVTPYRDYTLHDNEPPVTGSPQTYN